MTALLCPPPAARAQSEPPDPDPTRWEQTISAFETRDRKNSVPDNAVLFVGSSSIVGWQSAKDFRDLPVINRGFGGSHISDSTHYLDRIVLPYKPGVIVFYAGDNDVAGGKSAERVAKDFKIFSTRVHEALPRTPIIFVAIKPSIARWDKWATMRAANELIEAACRESDLLLYADIAAPMLGTDGKPREELFVKDGLHLNERGYAEWNRVVGPLIESARRTPAPDSPTASEDG
jgi:lysophospholipase L1-like esterase